MCTSTPVCARNQAFIRHAFTHCASTLTHVCAHAQTYSDACTGHFLQAPSSTNSHARFGRLHTCMCPNTHVNLLRRHFSTHTHWCMHKHACLRTQMSGRAYAHRRALHEYIHMCTHTYKFARACTKTCALTRMSTRAALYTTQHIHARANTYTSATHLHTGVCADSDV